jgi:hypothetical protein
MNVQRDGTEAVWNQLHRPKGLHWLLAHQVAQPAVLSLAFSPVGMIITARVVEHRWLHPGDQYVSFFWGDQALALSALAAGYALKRSGSVPKVFGHLGWTLSVASLSIAAGLLSWWADSKARLDGTGPLVYTSAQLLSPTKIWHNAFCYLPLGLVLGCCTVPALFSKAFDDDSPHAWLRVLAAAGIAFWLVSALWWDPGHTKPHAHISYTWGAGAVGL